MSSDFSLPPYTYVPGGPWPHPIRSPDGHSYGLRHGPVAAIAAGQWQTSPLYLQGITLFNAGYYWEAHECWEALWHAHGRSGPTAEVLQALIMLAAAGVKVLEGRIAGVRTHATRAASLLEKSHAAAGRFQLGLDLEQLIGSAREIAINPPAHNSTPTYPVTCVLGLQLMPRQLSEAELDASHNNHGTDPQVSGD